jgi:hypothetical protein
VPVDISTRYSIPTDLTKITYPDSYTVQTTSQSDVNTNPCNLDLSVVTLPKTWLGKFPLPDINGAPLSSGTMRAFKGYVTFNFSKWVTVYCQLRSVCPLVSFMGGINPCLV